MDANASNLGSTRRWRVAFGRWPNVFPRGSLKHTKLRLYTRPAAASGFEVVAICDHILGRLIRVDLGDMARRQH
jgi:hypothetical protein